jgi:hypothetical protein
MTVLGGTKQSRIFQSAHDCERARSKWGQARAFVGAVKDQKLVSQSEVFEEQIPARIDFGESNLNHCCQPSDQGFKDW